MVTQVMKTGVMVAVFIRIEKQREASGFPLRTLNCEAVSQYNGFNTVWAG